MVLRATQLRRTLAKLGASFVKIGQALSARPDLLPKPYLEVSQDPQLTKNVPTIAQMLFTQQVKIVHLYPDLSDRHTHSEPAGLFCCSYVYKVYLACSPASLTAGVACLHLQTEHNLRSHKSAALQALSQLQDRLEPFPTPTAMALIEEELGAKIGQIFSELSARPVAAASLGQVRQLPWQQHSMLASLGHSLAQFICMPLSMAVFVFSRVRIQIEGPEF